MNRSAVRGEADSPAQALLARAIPTYERFHATYRGTPGIQPHDAVAVAYCLAPELFEVTPWPVRVETGGLGRGKTWVAEPFHAGEGSPWASRPQVDVCTGVDAPAVARWIVERLAGQDRDPLRG